MSELLNYTAMRASIYFPEVIGLTYVTFQFFLTKWIAVATARRWRQRKK